MRYCESLLMASKAKKLTKSTSTTPKQPITVNEMKKAELEILKCVQRHHFAEEVNSLTRPSAVEGPPHVKSSCLCRLDPVLVDSLLRIGRRLSLASITTSSYQRTEHYHHVSGHSCKEYVLSLLPNDSGLSRQDLQSKEGCQGA